MITHQEVDAQLRKIGVPTGIWGRAEVRELKHILMPSEKILHLVNGRYQGGFATIVATDQRLLLVDKKIGFLSVEDIRYDMVAEVDYNARIIEASINICTVNKTLRFVTIRQGRIRALTTFVQQRVMELRQHQYQYIQQLEQQPYAAAQWATQLAPPTFTPVPDAQAVGPVMVPYNPYTKTPLLTRHRRFSRFTINQSTNNNPTS